MSDDLHAFLRSRRSIRKFDHRLVPADLIRRILETATYAPSAHNLQPWRFAVTQKTQTKIILSEAMAADFRGDLLKEGLSGEEIAVRLERSRRRILDAPVVIVLCMETAEPKAVPSEKHRLAEQTMNVQSTALAGLQLLLAAHAEGLGGVWTCGPLFTPEAVRGALALPSTWQPQGLFLIGFPAEDPEMPSKINLESLVLER